MKDRLPDGETMVRRIIDTYEGATYPQRVTGRGWYPAARRVVQTLAVETCSDERTAATVLAALSPRNPWKWNVQDAYSYLQAARFGQEMPSATTYKRNQRTAWDVANGITLMLKGSKVSAFVECILGDWNSVVVDVWAIRVVSGGVDLRLNDVDYRVVAAAYTIAASRMLLSPARVQATTWIVAQQAGLGSNRKGRSDDTYKAGTSDIVKEMLS